MDFNTYQQRTKETDKTDIKGQVERRRTPEDDEADLVVHLLGLTGEAGSAVTVYKKHLRDGPAYEGWRLQMREELGDVLWYVATVAARLGLGLQDIAEANLQKTRSRWLPSDIDQLDEQAPTEQQLPRQGRMEFRQTTERSPDGHLQPVVRVYMGGRQLGEPLKDNSRDEDGYRFHDVFHLAYAVMLGWSPVMRRNLKCKRKYDPDIDDAEDSGRAIVIEEGVAAFAFGYGALQNHLEGVARVDFTVLDSITSMTRKFEVGVRTAADWEQAILEGHRVFRELVKHQGGAVTFNADRRELSFSPPASA